MSYRNILVYVDNSPRAAARVKFALALAEKHDAHLTGLFVASPPYITVAEPYMAAGAIAASSEIYYGVKDMIERNAKAARAIFEQEAAHYQHRKEHLEWREQGGLTAEVVCMNARYHDLVVVGQHDASAPVDGLRPDFPQAVVLGCGRPVIVFPYAGDFTVVGKHVMVAWNASREATRALTDALPLLQGAEKVTVLTVNPEVSDAAHGEVPGADIAQYLARHGVNVEVAQASAFSRDMGEVLLSTLADHDIDLLVMGLYGHSRLRELVMGGASRTMLAAMTVPVLMSH